MSFADFLRFHWDIRDGQDPNRHLGMKQYFEAVIHAFSHLESLRSIHECSVLPLTTQV